MGDLREVRVPAIGDFSEVDVIEILVAPGDTIEPEASLITLESDKASLEIPSPAAGTVEEVLVAVGDRVSEGTPIVSLRIADDDDPAESVDAAPGTAGDAAGRATGPEPQEASADASEGPDDGATGEPAVAAGRSRPSDDEIDTDLLVVGSGPGGYAAAFRAADLGLRVTLVERHATLGGVCLNVGCIPSKALLHAAHVIDEVADLAEHGLRYGDLDLDLDALRGWKDDVVSRLTNGLARLADQRSVDVVRGTATFVAPHEVRVVDGDDASSLRFGQAIVAVGSRPIELPGFPDDDRIMDSTDALRLDDVPERLLVVGGGIIGMEMAQIHASLGARVTVVELADGLLPGVDRDLVRVLQRRVEGRYEAIHTGTRVESIETSEGGLRATFAAAEPLDAQEFDRVLVAVGRRANGDRIGLDVAGVTVDEHGVIPVDASQRTSVPHLFAIGDVTGGPMLAHKASHEGRIAAEVAAGLPSAFDARAIPSVAYTDPEVAWVGLTEEDARSRDVPYEKGVFPWAASGRALGLGRSDGLTKLLFDPDSGRLLGAGIVGINAGDLIAEATLAIEMGCDAVDLGATIHPHPTLSETLSFAAEAAEGTLVELYKPKRRG